MRNVSPPHERPEAVVLKVEKAVVEVEEEEAFQIEVARQFLISAQLHRSHHI